MEATTSTIVIPLSSILCSNKVPSSASPSSTADAIYVIPFGSISYLEAFSSTCFLRSRDAGQVTLSGCFPLPELREILK